MQLTELQLLTLLNYDTNRRRIFTYSQRIELHRIIAIVRDNRRHPDLQGELGQKVYGTLKLIKEFGWEREIIRIGQDRLPYITKASKL